MLEVAHSVSSLEILVWSTISRIRIGIMKYGFSYSANGYGSAAIGFCRKVTGRDHHHHNVVIASGDDPPFVLQLGCCHWRQNIVEHCGISTLFDAGLSSDLA